MVTLTSAVFWMTRLVDSVGGTDSSIPRGNGYDQRFRRRRGVVLLILYEETGRYLGLENNHRVQFCAFGG